LPVLASLVACQGPERLVQLAEALRARPCAFYRARAFALRVDSLLMF